MAIERKFIADNIRKLEVKEFLKKELARSGCGEIDIQRTPLGTRVVVLAQKPGLVIGKRGGAIRKLTNVLGKKYEIDNPQVEVNELDVPELNAQVMAESLASMLERGLHFRRAAYMTLRKIMEAGARGAQIIISGKITGERAKSVKFSDGYLKHCGEPARIYVRDASVQASLKPGIIGVRVKLMPPGVSLPDELEPTGLEAKVGVEGAPVKEEIEALAEVIEGEIPADEKEALKLKKLKPEKIKRKAAKKKKEEPTAEEKKSEAIEAEPKKEASEEPAPAVVKEETKEG